MLPTWYYSEAYISLIILLDLLKNCINNPKLKKNTKMFYVVKSVESVRVKRKLLKES